MKKKPSNTEVLSHLLALVFTILIGGLWVLGTYHLGIWFGDCGHNTEGFPGMLLLLLFAFCLFILLPFGFFYVCAISHGVISALIHSFLEKHFGK